ncbi:MAG: extracellular solute-binding protein [Actinobacteria bacterium]|nr:extracellular solute-binding protein [Actinomycetota bacterium]
MLGAGAAACSSTPSSASGKVTISWWSWTTNPKAVIANFEKAYPNIKVTVPPNYGSGATFYPKLTTALAGGTAPCVTQIEFDHLPQFLAQHDLTPITQYVSQYKSDFPGWVWNQVSQNGQVYAMPEDIGPMALMYQPSVLTKYNLPVPTTWAQFASDAVALHKADPSQYLTYFAPNDADQMEALWWQAGAFPYQVQSDGSWKVNVNGPLEQKVMQYWGNLVTEGAVKVDQDFQAAWTHHIAQDNYVAMIGAGWSPTYMVDAYLPTNSTQQWAIAEMPQWTAGAHAAANWGGSTNAVTKDCPSNLVKDAATFAAYINTAKSALSVDEKPATPSGGGRGLFPASLARASVSEFSAAVPHFSGNINAQFSQYAANVPVKFQWSPWDTELGTFLTTEMGKAAAGKEAWSQVLVNTQSQLVAYAKSAGYKVSS